jgi:succinate-acetate transporter protein
LGVYLITWWLMTVIVLLGTLKSSLELFLTILFLKFTFLLLAIG